MVQFSMFYRPIVALALVTTATISAVAHEVWIERDGTGVARVYKGPIEGPAPESGEKIDTLEGVAVFKQSRQAAASLTRKDDHFEANVSGEGDVRFFTDQIWKPWKNNDGKMEAAIFTGKAGRKETRPVLDFELVPIATDSDIFTVLYKGEPLAAKTVTVVTPSKWQKGFVTDENGRVHVPVQEKGRFILMSNHDVSANREIAGIQVTELSYITTVSFVAK
jgi:hypothetical protein